MSSSSYVILNGWETDISWSFAGDGFACFLTRVDIQQISYMPVEMRRRGIPGRKLLVAWQGLKQYLVLVLTSMQIKQSRA